MDSNCFTKSSLKPGDLFELSCYNWFDIYDGKVEKSPPFITKSVMLDMYERIVYVKTEKTKFKSEPMNWVSVSIGSSFLNAPDHACYDIHFVWCSPRKSAFSCIVKTVVIDEKKLNKIPKKHRILTCLEETGIRKL